MKKGKIINVSFPILHKGIEKPKSFDSKWLKALKTIKEWN